MSTFKHQLNLFYLALSFFSRLPVPKTMQYSAELLHQSNRYFSLVGIVLALILISFYSVANLIFPVSISIVLVIIISLLLTGAFHEDGLADMADGIGGGLTIEKRLTIMKDSRLGTYGTVTLVSALALKYVLLVELVNSQVFVVGLVAAYALSRAIAASLIFDMSYVTDANNSKSKPMAAQQTEQDLFMLFVIGAAPLLFLPLASILAIAIALLVFRVSFKAWLNKRIGGYTGDCLGAAQQISELLIYLVIVAIAGGNL